MKPSNSISIGIDGMSCANCANTAEQALKAIAGLHDAKVNFITATAQVHPGKADLSSISAALEDNGFRARTARANLSISGMHCASCVSIIEKALKEQPGVVSAIINPATSTAIIDYFEGAVTPGGLSETVTKIGYPAEFSAPIMDDKVKRDKAEMSNARFKAIAACSLAFPVFIIEMSGHAMREIHEAIHMSIGQNMYWLVQFLFATTALAWPGREFLLRGIPALFRMNPDMNSLVALGTLAAWGYSTVSLFAPSLLPQNAAAVYFESALVIIALILVGRWLEARAKGRAGEAIRRLIGLKPMTATVRRNDRDIEIPAKKIMVGDTILVRPGERFPVDAKVAEGQSHVDESMITGEATPVGKKFGMNVVAGSVNGEGSLYVKATKVGGDTMLARIIALVEEAQGSKLPVQALADRVIRVFVPVVLATGLIAFLTWIALGPEPVLANAMVAFVSVMIIACPCAMGLATPTSILVGTGRSAEMGVLFRKGEGLQKLATTRMVAFDKTGTLTLGKPAITGIYICSGFSESEVLRLAAAAETHSEHPIARTIEAEARGRGIASPKPANVTAVPGMGLAAQVDGHDILIGSLNMMKSRNVELKPVYSEFSTLETRGETPVAIAVNGEIAALIGISDPLGENGARTVSALRKMGIGTAIISGDTMSSTAIIADRLDIPHYRAGLLPGEKREALKELQSDFGTTAFAGDGINDAPALAHADIGISLGTGTDVAIESGDVVLTTGNIAGVANAIHMSRHTMRNIRQNLFWAFIYNIALIPVAAGVLYPAFGILLSPMLAAAAMALSSIFVVANALRLRHVKPALPV
ncbi:MAG: heavy metal translocating P-type ATPase [Roseovarius sp.]|nr:heavy metal translocating P-type ATPase [Roseovarius sp.]MCY4291296.1 heavy metal translocating P-type ATPase [Roseovarius sp.]